MNKNNLPGSCYCACLMQIILRVFFHSLLSFLCTEAAGQARAGCREAIKQPLAGKVTVETNLLMELNNLINQSQIQAKCQPHRKLPPIYERYPS